MQWAPDAAIEQVSEYVVVPGLTDEQIEALLEAEAADAAQEAAAADAAAEAQAASSQHNFPRRLVDYDEDDDEEEELEASHQTLSPLQRAGGT